MHEIKVNLPTSQEDYKDGIGEGCWVIVDDETFNAYQENKNQKNCKGILHNDSIEYPRFTVGTKIYFELRGAARPVADYNFLNDPTVKVERIDL